MRGGLGGRDDVVGGVEFVGWIAPSSMVAWGSPEVKE